MTGTNMAGCDVWITCNGGLLAYVQQRCEAGGGYVWHGYTMSALHAGCGGCD